VAQAAPKHFPEEGEDENEMKIEMVLLIQLFCLSIPLFRLLFKLHSFYLWHHGTRALALNDQKHKYVGKAFSGVRSQWLKTKKHVDYFT